MRVALHLGFLIYKENNGLHVSIPEPPRLYFAYYIVLSRMLWVILNHRIAIDLLFRVY